MRETEIFNELKKQGVPDAMLTRPETRIVKAGNSIYDMDEYTDTDIVEYLKEFDKTASAVWAVMNTFKTQCTDYENNSFYINMKQSYTNLKEVIRVFKSEKTFRGI